MAMDPVGSVCSGGIYPKGSRALANINSTVHELAAKASASGFATSSVGRGSTAIYGLAQCRGDVSPSRCKACLAAAAAQILEICNDAYELKIWFDYCFMRYKNANFSGQIDMGDSVNLASAQTMDNPKTFQRAVGKVMGKATAQAVAAGSGGLGRAKQQYTPFVSVYVAHYRVILHSSSTESKLSDWHHGIHQQKSAVTLLVLVSLALLPLGMAMMDPIGVYCTGAVYAKGSKGFANINSVVSDLAARGSVTGFATSSVGKGNNVIYGLAQCRGDVPDSDCAARLAGAASQIATSCNYPSDARIWYDYCFMRYKNEDFIGQMDADTAPAPA
ncbi:hypothetical protein GUJ93_ZPchr0003g18372 [Zizania palustris]|uniref:Gnk2-homologous domain-containing protein n=1 Tax=Zizania palustris TaxID=103762 RepID=A0A8J5SMU9_ZIZPA|nr:hypothetical protein GUJ93_ZPchr0003g18372 [Zizania palustris]